MPGQQMPQGKAPQPGQQPQGTVQPQERGITNIETEQALTQPNLPPTQPDINALAGQLAEQNPDRFINPQDAYTEASNILNSEYN
jgi:hypothetical protein